MPRRKPDADRPVTRAEVEARLARKVKIWAETWRRCPKKGCRRAGECLRFDRCAGLPAGPAEWPSEETQRWFRDMIDREKVRRGLAARPGYDPDARERDRPMPPAPRRVAPPSRPGKAEPDPSRDLA